MMTFILCLITIFSCSIAASEWVELPKMTPLKENVIHSLREVSIPSFQTSTSHISVEFPQPTLSLVGLDKIIETDEMAEKKLGKPQNYTMGEVGDYNDEKGFSVLENQDTSFVGSNQSNDVEDVFVLKETINEIKNKFITEPRETVAEKLKYLKKIQNKLLAQTRMYVEGIWTHPSRQARDKKLMGFPSMEGALMTIAFLTFAVFLIKIVMQFIRGLENAEQTLLMTLSSTPAPVRISNRPKRAARNLAAAEILRYIDEYSIKHKLHCDFN